jgi:Mlc titration factor MtfA (ptsG expression regulator)
LFFFRRNRRPDLLASCLDDQEWNLVRQQAPLLDRLPEDNQLRVQGVTRLLLEEKNFEGCGGLQLTPDMPLLVCAQAALLQLGPGADYFPGLDSVLVYPEAFLVEHARMDEVGLIIEGEEELAGESWQRGAVILSWEDVARESSTPGAGYNVVLHEFAHQLDDQTGEADGTPLLADGDLLTRWPAAFSEAFERHVGDLEQDCHVLFDQDAAESPAEFFATAAELFFTLPLDFKKEFPGLYGVLGEHLGLDPAAW